MGVQPVDSFNGRLRNNAVMISMKDEDLHRVVQVLL